jgi:RNA polymerase sigma-70 factor (ECF subfamily)
MKAEVHRPPPFRNLRKASAAEVATQVRELYASVGPMILGLGHRYFGARRDLAEDLVSETFARVLAGIRGFEGRSSYSTWIFGIALRVAATWQRRGASEPTEPLAPGIPGGEDTLEIVAQRSRRQTVQSAFDALSAEHRMVLSLTVVDGLSQVEVAELLGIPAGTVYSRYARARVALARELGKRGLDGAH